MPIGDSGADNRSYRLFEKINKTLPGFKCDWNAQNGAQQLFDLFTELICQKTPSCLEGSLVEAARIPDSHSAN